MRLENVFEKDAYKKQVWPRLSWFMNYYHRYIVDDDDALKAVFYTCVSAYTDEPLNLFLRGESSIGKTYIARTVSSLFPRSDVMLLAGLSPKALVHQPGVYIDENGEEIDPYSPPSKDDPEAYHEFRRRLMNAKKVIDLKHKIMIFLEAPSQETMMALRPLLSHDDFEVEYRFTDKTARGALMTRIVILRNWPATIFCTSYVKYLEDLATRSLSVSPRVSEEKFRKAMEVAARRSMSIGEGSDAKRERSILEQHVRNMERLSGAMKVVIPFAEQLSKVFPSTVARAMRDFQHFLGMVKSSALLHFHSRPCLRINDDVILLANLSDAIHCLHLFANIAATTFYGMPESMMKFYDFLLANFSSDFRARDVESIWNMKNPTQKLSTKTIWNRLQILEDANLVSSEPDPSDRRVTLFHVIHRNVGSSIVEDVGNAIREGFTLEFFRDWLKTLVPNSPKPTLHRSFVNPEPTTVEKVYNCIIGKTSGMEKKHEITPFYSQGVILNSV